MDKMRWLLAGVLGLALAAGGVGVGIAGNQNGDARTGPPQADEAEDAAEGEDVAIGDEEALRRAFDATLAWLAEQGLEGDVTDTEQGDEESFYEIEVTLTDGRQVDVQLNEEFNVVGREFDGRTDEDDEDDEVTESEANEDEDAVEDAAEGEDTAIQDQSALEDASAAALAWLAEQGLEGEVTDTEQGDEESRYEVEVTLSDGRQVDVQLDEAFTVIGLD